MATLKRLFNAINESAETSSAVEIKAACEFIIEVQTMDFTQRDCLCAAYRHGPLFDGDLSSHAGPDILLEKGYMANVVVNGEDGFKACTYKGARAYRLLEAGA